MFIALIYLVYLNNNKNSETLNEVMSVGHSYDFIIKAFQRVNVHIHTNFHLCNILPKTNWSWLNNRYAFTHSYTNTCTHTLTTYCLASKA